MSAFWHLVRQDLNRVWPAIAILIGTFVVWLMIYQSMLQPGSPVFSALLYRMILIYIAVAIWRGIHSFGVWSTSRMHLLLSLPTPGIITTGAAFFVLWSELILYGLAIFSGASLLSSLSGLPLIGLGDEVVGWSGWLTIFLRIFLLIAIIAAIFISILQFSWLLGRSFRLYHGPVSILTLVGLLWIFLRLGMAIGSWGTGEIPFTFYLLAESYEARGLTKMTFNLMPLLGMLGLSGVLFWLGARLFEERIEV